MTAKFVVGLFESKGIAEDACNRLITEGVPADGIALTLLHEFTRTSSNVSSELAALSVDPFVVGDVQETYAPYISNGETAVFVRAHSEAEVEFAIDTIRQYAPLRIRVVSAGEGAALGHDVL